jgi:hydroxyacylglutathione hydrolase
VKTQTYPFKEIVANTYEIGEFDCASIFLLIGDDKAMVIDTGIGIGSYSILL